MALGELGGSWDPLPGLPPTQDPPSLKWPSKCALSRTLLRHDRGRRQARRRWRITGGRLACDEGKTALSASGYEHGAAYPRSSMAPRSCISCRLSSPPPRCHNNWVQEAG
eukprot:859514-Pelagomonas_calceolata.AAC.2